MPATLCVYVTGMDIRLGKLINQIILINFNYDNIKFFNSLISQFNCGHPVVQAVGRGDLFNTQAARVGFAVDDEAIGQASCRVLWFSPVSRRSINVPHSFSFVCH